MRNFIPDTLTADEYVAKVRPMAAECRAEEHEVPEDPMTRVAGMRNRQKLLRFAGEATLSRWGTDDAKSL
jgi:hypothetical protein